MSRQTAAPDEVGTRQAKVNAAVPAMNSREFLRWAWRQLTSMRTALLLLLLLALAAIPGSLFPQRSAGLAPVNDYLANNPVLGRVLDALGMFDVFGSIWFTAIYLLLLISIIGCVVPRMRAHLQSLRSSPPPTPANLRRLAGYRVIETTKGSTEVLGAAAEWLRKSRWRVSVGVDGSVSAEKGYSRETGNLVFHGALVVIVIGVAVGALWGYRGQVLVREGTGFSNVLVAYDDFSAGRLFNPTDLPPFTVELEEFAAEFERFGSQRGAPRLFEASVNVRDEPNSAFQPASLRVNHPLEFDGTKVFLTGHGYAPVITVTDPQGQLQFSDSVVFLPRDGNYTSIGVLKLPDAPGQIALEAIFLPSAVLDEEMGPVSVFPSPDSPALFLVAWKGDLGVDTGEPQNVFRLDTADLERLGVDSLVPGQTWSLPEVGTVSFDGVARFISIQIAHEPGRELVLVASIAALVGLLFGLFVPRRRLWVKLAESSSESSRVEVAGLSRHGYTGLVEEIDRLAEVIKQP